MEVVKNLLTEGHGDEGPLPIEDNVVHDQEVAPVWVVGAESVWPLSNVVREALGDEGDEILIHGGGRGSLL